MKHQQNRRNKKNKTGVYTQGLKENYQMAGKRGKLFCGCICIKIQRGMKGNKIIRTVIVVV